MDVFLIVWLSVTVLAVIALVIFQPKRHLSWLVLISLLVAFSLWVTLPNNSGIHVDTNGDGEKDIDTVFEFRQGLDLAGGVKVLLEADIAEDEELEPGAMEEVRRIVENRIDALGALEPTIQLQGERRIVVELPGYEDPDSAVDLIRETAQLEFVDIPAADIANGRVLYGLPILTSYQVDRDPSLAEPASEDAPAPTVYETVMTGDVLLTAGVQIDQNTNTIYVAFQTTNEGRTVFGDYTTTHIGQPLGIVLDGVLISAPSIRDAITSGEGVIDGDFTIEEAQQLATQLRYGALPVALRVESTSTVGPTLGQVSVEKSISAGLIGIGIVLLFMIIYYRVPGIAAAIALLVFALLNLTIYKVLPVTMTLPAITGFLISVGTAVDGNILIFERMKEELRNGKSLDAAVRAGFDRAWTSIRDSNLSTLIIAAVLYFFGSSFGAGAVRGFAITLGIGLVLNLFTAITVTRTVLHFILLPLPDETLTKRRWLLGL